jgi:hypothetical protein
MRQKISKPIYPCLFLRSALIRLFREFAVLNRENGNAPHPLEAAVQ